MSIDHNRIKVADLEKNQPNKILTTNSSGELEFGDMYNDLDCMVEGKVLDARQGKELKKLIDNINDFLSSDNSNLDTVQELVDAIETVQNSLNTILVNDLSTGGTTKALTAEMGKTLKGFIDSLTTVLNNHLGSEDAHNELFENKVDKEAGKSLLSDTEINRLATLSNYTHPANHPASIIVQDSNNRFVTDTEKAAWNDKPTYTGSGANGTWGINISGTASFWDAYQSGVNTNFDQYFLGYDGTTGKWRPTNATQAKTLLGLTSAISGTLTAGYLPIATGAGTLGNSSLYESGGTINTNLSLNINNGTVFKLTGYGATAPVSPSVGDIFYDNGRLKIKSTNSGSGSDGSLGFLNDYPINLMGLGIDSLWVSQGDLNGPLDVTKWGYTSLIKTPYAYQQTLSVHGTLNAHPDMYEGTLITSNGGIESQQLFFDSAGLIYARGKGYVAGQGVWRKYVYQGVDKLLVNTTVDNGYNFRVVGSALFTGGINVFGGMYITDDLAVDGILNAAYAEFSTITSQTISTQSAITISNGFSSPASEAGYRIKFSDNGGTNNDSGIGLNGSAGAEQMWFNTLGGFSWQAGTGGEKMSLSAGGNLVVANNATATQMYSYSYVDLYDTNYYVTPSGTTVLNQLRTKNSNGIRLHNDNAYISFYNTAGTTRNGYLQFSNNSVELRSEQGNKLTLLNQNGGGTVIGNVTWDGSSLLQVGGIIKAPTLNILNSSGGTGYILIDGSQAGHRKYLLENAVTGISNSGFQIRDVTGGFTPFYIDGSGNSVFNGTLQINPTSGGNWNDGIRVGNHSGGFSIINFGTDSTLSGLNADGNQWMVGKNPSGAFQIVKNGSSSTSGLAINASDIWFNNSIMLRANNYNSYAPTLTGGGASGNWNISVTNSNHIAFNDDVRNLSNRLPNSAARTVKFDFVYSSVIEGTGNYGGVMSFNPWDGTTSSTGDSSYQLAFGNRSGVNASGVPDLKIRNGIDTTWNSWHTLLHTGNYGSYVPSLTGAGASGNWNINATSANLLSPLGNYVWNASTNGRDFTAGLQISFVSSAQGYPNYGTVLRGKSYSPAEDGSTFEMYYPYSESYGGNSIKYRIGSYNNAGMSSWRSILDNNNYSSYSNFSGGVIGQSLAVTNGDGAGYGLSLYGSHTNTNPSYGLMFATTANYGTHGYVTADWATYLTMEGSNSRGWIFKHSNVNRASIDGYGNARFNGDVRSDGNLISNAGSYGSGYLGTVSSSWGGGLYPTLFSSSADRWVMHINPHISYVQNGVNGHTGAGMTGATIRFAADTNAGSYWDLGVGTNSMGADKFSIGRGGNNYFSISNNGGALVPYWLDVMQSIYAYGGLSVGTAGSRTGNLANANSIAIGDTDTGFRQNGDGVLEVFSNNILAASFYANNVTFSNAVNATNFYGSNFVGNATSAFGMGTYSNANSLTAAGFKPNAQWDSRPGGNDAFVLGHHTGVTIHGYGGYGGVRLYSAGYPDLTSSVLRLEASDSVKTYGYLYNNDTISGVNGVFSGTVNASRLFTGYDSGVANSVSCSDWFRSSGSTGWYSATYGGGIYMVDSTYVRVYNGKALKVENVIEASGSGGFASSTYAVNSRNPIWRFGNADAYGLSYFQGTSGIDGSQDSIGFHFGGATATDSKVIIHYDGSVLMSGVLYVGRGTTSSSIRMQDSDEGERYLHCNSNRIGFLTQAGGWGSYCLDDGSWNTEGNMSVAGTVTAAAFYASSDIQLKDITDYKPKVADLKPISFTWKDKRDEKVHIGYPAQEVQKVLPDAVQKDDKGFLSVDYIQVLVAKIAEMEQEINNLKKQLQ